MDGMIISLVVLAILACIIWLAFQGNTRRAYSAPYLSSWHHHDTTVHHDIVVDHEVVVDQGLACETILDTAWSNDDPGAESSWSCDDSGGDSGGWSSDDSGSDSDCSSDD